MTEALPAGTSPPHSPVLSMYTTVMGVGIGCALIIVAVHETTKPVIQRNRIELRQLAIFDVLPGARTTAAFRFRAGGFEQTSTGDESDDVIFAGFDDQQQLVGLAIEAQGRGYQDIVRVLYGYSFDQQAVIGLRILESRETPGLGDRVESDKVFLANFQRLDVGLSDTNGTLAHDIEFVKPGEKQSPWQIDGITGATITSRSIADMLRESTAVWVPRVNQQPSVFRHSGTAASDGSGEHE